MLPEPRPTYHPPPVPAVLCWSIACSAAILTIFWHIYTIQDLIGEFFMFVLVVLSAPVALGILIWSLIYLPLRFRQQRFAAAFALILNLATLVSVPFLPNLTRDAHFYLEYPFRMHVVHIVELNQLRRVTTTPESCMLCGSAEVYELPAYYRGLSKWQGRILVSKGTTMLQVLFPQSVGLQWEFGGYAYRSDRLPPLDVVGSIHPMQAPRRYTDFWYWIQYS